MVDILKSFSQGLKNLSPGINQAAAGAAETSPLWAKDLINRRTLGRKVEVEREETERRNTLREAEEARKRAKYGLELAIKSRDPVVIHNAVKYSQDAGLLDPLMDPLELAQSLIPDPLKDVEPKLFPGDPTQSYYFDPTSKKLVITPSGYESPPPVFADFIDDAKEWAKHYGYAAGLSHLRNMMDRDLLPEEVERVKEDFTLVSPIINENAGIFRLLGTMTKDERTRVFYGLTPTLQGELMNDYNVALDLGIKPIQAFEAKAKEAGTPLMALDLVADYLADEKYTSIMGPTLGTVLGWNAYHKDAKVFQARMLLTTQIVGKFLEGGVLRQEDTIKYREMLPKLGDLPEVANSKVRMLRQMITGMRNLYMAGGVVRKTLDDEGKETNQLVVEALPWNPSSPNVPLKEVQNWLLDNKDHAYFDQVDSVFNVRYEHALYLKELEEAN